MIHSVFNISALNPFAMGLLEFVAWTASVATIGMFSSSIPACWKIHKTKSTGLVAYLPFLAGVLNCVLWLSYGYMIGDLTVFWVNFTGLVLNAGYTVVFVMYTQTKDEVLLRCGILLVFVLVILGYFFYIETDNLRGINALGIFCNVVAVAFFASPLATMREVVQTKSTETMSLPLSVMAAITTFLWTSYGFLKKDVYIVMPNLLGFLLTCTQLALFAIYWSSPKKRVVSIERLV